MKMTGVGRGKRMTAIFEDESGKIELVWFQGVEWVKKSVTPGRIYQIYGKAKKFATGFNIAHPEVTAWENVDQTIDKVYRPCKGEPPGFNSSNYRSRWRDMYIHQDSSASNPDDTLLLARSEQVVQVW